MTEAKKEGVLVRRRWFHFGHVEFEVLVDIQVELSGMNLYQYQGLELLVWEYL